MSTLHTCLNGNCNSPICLKIIRQWVLRRATTYFAKIISVVRASRNARQIWKSQSETGVTSFCTFLRRSWFMHWLDSNHGWNIFVRWQDTKAWITVLIYIYVATLFLCGHSLVYFCHTPVIRILVLLTEKNLPCWGQFFFFSHILCISIASILKPLFYLLFQTREAFIITVFFLLSPCLSFWCVSL